MRVRPNRCLLRSTIISATGTTAPTGFWNLNQAAAAARTDSCANACNLTVSGTVSQVSGKISFAASVASGLNSLSNISAPSKMNTGGTFSFCGWINLNNSAGGNVVALGSNTTTGWNLTVSTTHLILKTYQAGPASTTLDVTVSLSTSTFYFIAGYYDSSVLAISLNGAAFTTGAGNAPATVSTPPFTLLNNNSGSNAMQGSLDEFGYWVGYKLTSAEVTDLYNGGTGKTFNGSAWV